MTACAAFVQWASAPLASTVLSTRTNTVPLARCATLCMRLSSSRCLRHSLISSRIAIRRPVQHSGSRRRAVTPAHAALYSLPEVVQSGVQTGTIAAIAVALALSALPILTGDAKERNEERAAREPADQLGADTVRWSVMGVLSFIPLINPLSWVFAALDDEESSALYYSFAAIYTLPYLANGLELDGFAVACLLLGAAHVQLERIACTEAVEVELPQVLRSLLRAIPAALRGVGRYSSRLGSEVGDRARSAAQAQERRPERKQLEEQSREARAQLEEFDRRRRRRQSERERERDGNGSL